jgi:NNMT/PNMT/TEMT family
MRHCYVRIDFWETVTMVDASRPRNRDMRHSASVLTNLDYPWDKFDSEAYLEKNYSTILDDDIRILEFVRAFFAEVAPRPVGKGVDVGTGPNLYPTLAMLPYCEKVTLYEYSTSNVDWLRAQCRDNWPSWKKVWQEFWDRLSDRPEYSGFLGWEPRTELTDRTEVVQGSVFDLDAAVQQYEIGTMFFVAESISPLLDEFASAMGHFLDILRPGAPFAIALMEHSTGYDVAGTGFPSTNIGGPEVLDILRRRASNIRVNRSGVPSRPLRHGYTGMIVACGQVKGDDLGV